MDDNEIVEMLEESWYYSVLEDIIQVFHQYGRDNVLRDVTNLIMEYDRNSEKALK